MADYAQPEYVERRVRYYDGQFLREQDFIDEQSYHLDRERRLARMIFTPGLLFGFTVTPIPNAAKVTVSPGTAIDGQGRQLVRADDTPPLDLADQTNQDGPVPLLIAVTYHEVEDGAVPGGGSPRWNEAPTLVAFAEGAPDAPPQDSHIRIARVLVGPGSTADVDAAFQPTRGGIHVYGATQVDGPVQIDGPLRAGATLRVDGAAQLAGGISGVPAIDGGPPTLHIDGDAQIRGTRGYDSTTRLDVVNGSADFGRTNLVLTGRLQDNNDDWAFGSGGRTSVVFALNESASGENLGTVGDEQHSMQLEGTSKSLGFLTRDRDADPALVITQSGSVGVSTKEPDPSASLDVAGDLVVRQDLLVGEGIASRDIGRWTAANQAGEIAITIQPGSAHNFIVVQRGDSEEIGKFSVHVQAETTGRWFGHYTCFDPTSQVIGTPVVLGLAIPMIGYGNQVPMTNKAPAIVLILELHQITTV